MARITIRCQKSQSLSQTPTIHFPNFLTASSMRGSFCWRHRKSLYFICLKREKSPHRPPEAKPPMANQHFEKLQKKMNNLSKKMAKTVKPPASSSCPQCRTNDHSRSNFPSPYCPFCRNNTHLLSNCTQRPPAGTCFDCRRPSCRRGKPGCPGRTEASS